MPDPIVKTVTVRLDPDRAFRLFTEDIAEWWPLDTHSLSAQDGHSARSVDVPDTVGEQVIETRSDGRTEPWGRVTDYRPGRAFGMTWHVGRPEEEATHVQVSFDAVADGTRVRLIHDGWDKATARRDSYATGWTSVLARFTRHVTSALAPA